MKEHTPLPQSPKATARRLQNRDMQWPNGRDVALSLNVTFAKLHSMYKGPLPCRVCLYRLLAANESLSLELRSILTSLASDHVRCSITQRHRLALEAHWMRMACAKGCRAQHRRKACPLLPQFQMHKIFPKLKALSCHSICLLLESPLPNAGDGQSIKLSKVFTNAPRQRGQRLGLEQNKTNRSLGFAVMYC